MRGHVRRQFLAFLMTLSLGGILHAQRGPELSANYLHHLIHDSGIIFAGTVLHVQTANTHAASDTPVSRITFRVEVAVRGVRRGQTINVSEWGGLWQAGEQYRAGERVFLFLYPRSKLGLTSPRGRAVREICC